MVENNGLRFKKYSFETKIEQIKKRILVFSGDKDILHNYERTVDMVRRIKGSKLINLKTNDKTHSEEMVRKMRDYLDQNNLFKQ